MALISSKKTSGVCATSQVSQQKHQQSSDHTVKLLPALVVVHQPPPEHPPPQSQKDGMSSSSTLSWTTFHGHHFCPGVIITVAIVAIQTLQTM
jgi:hypothetical protein